MKRKHNKILTIIDKYGKEITTSEPVLSNIESKEITQIGFYKNFWGEIEAVRMPKTIKKVANQLPHEITSVGYMFYHATKFNQEIWTNVKTMSGMFENATSLSQNEM